jgi:hypothetical protein
VIAIKRTIEIEEQTKAPKVPQRSVKFGAFWLEAERKHTVLVQFDSDIPNSQVA